MNDASDEHMILLVGAEGGGVSLRGRKLDDGWHFLLRYSDQTPAMLDEDPIEVREWTTDWDDALRFLDAHRWERLQPIYVHPEFTAKVLEAILPRIGKAYGTRPDMRDRLAARWMDRCAGAADRGS